MTAEFLCVGISHKSAPLGLRERLAFSPEKMAEVLALLGRDPHELVLVSTCNRVEFYVSAPVADEAARAVRTAIVETAGEQALEHLYEKRGDAALSQLFRVAASLDSMVVGEPQILGQVKDAFELAQKAGAARGELTRIYSAAFASAKRVRTETGIGRMSTSMASAAVELSRKIFGGLEDKAVLLLGAGEMAEVAGRHLVAAGASSVVVVNRTLERATALAGLLGGTGHTLDALFAELVRADVVICTTASLTPILTLDNVAPVLKARRHRPLFMVDLAVPRDIAPDVNTLDGVYTYDIDDIQKIVAENAASRSSEAVKAELLVAEEVTRFIRARAVREGVPVLAQLRAQAEQIARAEVERSLGAWGADLSDKQKKSLEAMALSIVNKLLHQPTAKLRAVATDAGGERLAGAAAELFGLDDAGKKRTGSDNG